MRKSAAVISRRCTRTAHGLSLSPTYAWRIPRIVEAWLKNTELVGDKRIYFVMTCGGASETPGNTLNGSFRKKNMRYMGCAAVTMPENYIAMFSVPDRSEAMEIIARAEHAIDHARKYA